MSTSRKVANKKDMTEGGVLRVEPDGKPIVLAMIEGKIYAIDATCTHKSGPLDQGKLEGYKLTCPWHHAIFDVRNGTVSDKTVWATNLNSYPVQVDESTGDISISLQRTQQRASQAEETLQPQRTESKKEENNTRALENEKLFYEEEERNASDKLSIQLLRKEKLEGTDIITFKLTKGNLDFAAGQFAYFKLEGVTGDPKGSIRHFSIASSPTEQDYILISTRIRDTPYKQKLASLSDGTKITTWGPQGEFVLQEDKPGIFLSGGIGVTPFRSMIKYATDKKLPTKIVMFDSNRNRGNILYKDEFDGWARANPNIKIIYTVSDEEGDSSGWNGERGMIDKKMLSKYLSNEQISESTYYICGPPGMLKAMQSVLKDQLQISEDKIRTEEFTGY